MALFRPVLKSEDLPAAGSTAENYSVDLKARQEPTLNGGARWDLFEMAKDVASFANAVGGTILVGIQEERATNTVSGYVPLDESTSTEVCRRYEEAVRDRCSPAPFIHCLSLKNLEGSGWTTAINVWALPSQLVGVRIRGDVTDGFGDSAFVFPMRSGRQTLFLRPELLPMLMDPGLRRIVVLLESIPVGAGGKRTVLLGPPQGLSEQLELIDVLPLENIVVLSQHRTEGAVRCHVPIDAVISVYRGSVDQWVVEIDGWVEYNSMVSTYRFMRNRRPT